MDLLREAWELLEDGERPEGMSYRPNDSHFRFAGCWSAYSKIEARDRLLVAVEGANLAAGMAHEMVDGRHVWGKFPDVYGSDEDRLAAAVAARRAERGG